MKRLISGMEAVQAGIHPGVVTQTERGNFRRAYPDLPAVGHAFDEMPNMDAFRLWRSLPGYRKACRMLRRSGHRIPRNNDQRDARALFDDAAVFGLSERRRTQCHRWT